MNGQIRLDRRQIKPKKCNPSKARDKTLPSDLPKASDRRQSKRTQNPPMGERTLGLSYVSKFQYQTQAENHKGVAHGPSIPPILFTKTSIRRSRRRGPSSIQGCVLMSALSTPKAATLPQHKVQTKAFYF